jgi:taurine dioxygenase
VKWQWQAGDVVVWDNRCTIHAATGYDYEKYLREMWRLTLIEPPAAAAE